MQQFLSKKTLKDNWGKIALISILLIIICLNIKPGHFILGNDNYSPELDPSLTLRRSIFSPGWRGYRVLGMSSDSEQADIFRTLLFWLADFVFPKWAISQGYVFLTLFLGCFSISLLAREIFKQYFSKKQLEIILFFSGLFYLSNMLTSWLFFSPLRAFIAVYGFLPLVLLRLARFYKKQTLRNLIFLIVSLFLLSTSALIATLFIVEVTIISLFIIFFFLQNCSIFSLKKNFLVAFLAFVIVLSSQFFWLVPFIRYVQTNSPALVDSYINRYITTNTLEIETKNNTWMNSIRYFFSWIDIQDDNNEYTFPYRNWYKESFLIKALSYLPVILATLGVIYIFRKKKKELLVLSLMAFLGWALLNGVNPPAGFIFAFLQAKVPLFKQAFRWQSSKLWPFLAMSLPLLGSLGIIFVWKLTQRLSRFFSLVIILILTLTSLVFIFPYFKGDLINDRDFVKIPNEYLELADYLKQNDRSSRIYPAPEANTLYFRNYQWGFWGSIILNYLLPNPIIEKALIIGSYENEQAQDVLEDAYYSEDPEIFTRALRIYETPLVLSDKNASNKKFGYNYNWDVHKKVIEENPDLKKIWEKGNLALYRLNTDKRQEKFQPISFLHDWIKLNKIFAKSKNESPRLYYSEKNTAGTIYPFALDFEEIKVLKNEIMATVSYQGPELPYQLFFPEDRVADSPTKISFNSPDRLVSLSPSSPLISISGSKINNQAFAVKNYELDSDSSFLSLGSEVVDLREKSSFIKTYSTLYKNLDSEMARVREWLSSVQTIEERKFNVDQDSIIEIEIVFSSEEEPLTLCLWSHQKQKCLNKNIATYPTREPRKAVFLFPEVIEKNDEITLFFSREIDIQKLLVKLYQGNSLIKPVEVSIAEESSSIIIFHPGDELSLHVPKIYGQNSFLLDLENGFLPEVFHGDCDSRETSSGYLKINSDNSIDFNTKDCNDGFFTQLERLEPNEMAAIFVEAENFNAIPLDLSLRNKKEEYENYKQRMLAEKKSAFLDFVILPEEMRSYFLEIYSSGIGPRMSKNRLNHLIFQFIPQSWYEIKLLPENVLNENIFAINQAVSADWQLSKKAEAVRVNGWQQGWILLKREGIDYYFLLDRLAYFGFFAFILVLVVSSIWVLKNRNDVDILKSQKEKSPVLKEEEKLI